MAAKMTKITLPWARKFRELINSGLSDATIIKDFERYSYEQEALLNADWKKHEKEIRAELKRSAKVTLDFCKRVDKEFNKRLKW